MSTGLIPYLETATRTAGKAIRRNSPTILTGLGVAGLVSTVALAISATPKALMMVKEEEEYNESYGITNPDGSTNLTKLEIVKLTWKCYIPTAIMGGVTTLCIISANSISMQRTAALAGLYSLTETALKEYKAKVVATLGEKKEDKLRSEMAQDKLDANPVSANTILVTGKGDTLCYDILSGRYFKNDIETLRRVQNNFNHQLLSDMFVTLNELYDEMGLPQIDLGKSIGWSVSGGMLDFRFDAKLTPDGIPCLVVDHRWSPGYNDY
jgi:hypothetical protein